MRWHLSIADIDARIEALQSCIDHLGGHWTDNEIERKQGVEMQKQFRKQIARLVEYKRTDSVAP
jgi:hypothetical protein